MQLYRCNMVDQDLRSFGVFALNESTDRNYIIHTFDWHCVSARGNSQTKLSFLVPPNLLLLHVALVIRRIQVALSTSNQSAAGIGSRRPISVSFIIQKSMRDGLAGVSRTQRAHISRRFPL